MATILRKDSRTPPAAGRVAQPIAFSFADMRGRADDYLDAVRCEAAKIIQAAHADAEQIRRQAEITGRQAAEAAIERILEEKVARRMDTIVPALERLIAQMNDAKGELLTHWQRSAVRVSTAIAERIIRRELDREPQIALDRIEEALRLAAGGSEIRLHLSPTDFEHLGPQVERLAATLCRLAPSEIVADPKITPGGCYVTTKYGQIDQQIESQLRRIEEELES